MTVRESQIEKHLVDAVNGLGGEVRKVAWVGRRGAPDRCVMLRGTTTFIELKAPGKKAAVHQAREHKRMRDMGQTVLVLDSIDAVDAFVGEFQ